MDETHLSVILDLLKNGELTETKATAAIRRMAEHTFAVDSGDEARFAKVYHETIEPGYRENYHRPWSPDDIQLLKTMRRSGSDFDQIARRLKRSNRGVRSRWAFETMLEREAGRGPPPPPPETPNKQMLD
jgi:hypothetical protein